MNIGSEQRSHKRNANERGKFYIYDVKFCFTHENSSLKQWDVIYL